MKYKINLLVIKKIIDVLNENYFDELLQEIREIRISERNFYQKITDIYTTSLDYNVASPITKDFFKTVQNKMTLLFIINYKSL